MLSVIKSLIPKSIFRALQPPYHYALAFIGALAYRFPSRKLTVIGVTGTKGKSTTIELIGAIFETAGYKTALSNTVRFKVNAESTPNRYKMTMPGRFFMQKFLRQAVKAGCTHAVIELTSEGAVQYRHKFIELDALVVTNIAPEHIESHGSYENYVAAKLSLAESLAYSSKPRRLLVVNKDDKEALRFLSTKNVEKHTYSLKDAESHRTYENGIEFKWRGEHIKSLLRGTFNIYNMLAAAACAQYCDISQQHIAGALSKFPGVPGRMEKIDEGQNFEVIVDYAHTPESLEAVYQTFEDKRKICVLGNTGGGRDKWKRPKMGGIVSRHCDEIILTNEDPYDEDPRAIVDEMAKGMDKTPQIIMDRREAIAAALSKAAAGDVVLITGKGTDHFIMGPRGEKTPWSDAEVAREEVKKLLHARTA